MFYGARLLCLNGESNEMAVLYRGDGPGSHWHTHDARVTGFIPKSPGALPSNSRLMNHIARASVGSPYISFSRSFGVARTYALLGPHGVATHANPGYVWEIEVADDTVCRVLDPVIEIAKTLPSPHAEPPYQHDGGPGFLMGLVDPVKMKHLLDAPCVQPPGSAGVPRPANLSIQLEALVRALRDAEVLILGNVPAAFVRSRYDVTRHLAK